ncbi:molybdopterin biosynthesis protein [Clostridium sp. JNZ J1-5]
MNNFQRNVYLSNLELEEAKELFFTEVEEEIEALGTEILRVEDSLNRIAAKPVFAKISSPYFNASAMDGIAIRYKSTFEANEVNPIRLKKGSDFIYVDTGDVIKDPFDSVIMIEDVVKIDDETVEIIKAASPWQHVRPVGEDIVASEMIIPAFHKITPVDIGALLSGGILEIAVIKKPRVGIIPTGTEIINPEEEISEGKIIDSNSRMFEALVVQYGGQANRYKPIIDDYKLIKEAMIKAVEENDLVVINAGSSAGSEDYSSKIIEELGKVVAHGIAIKPGKPAILGKINNKPVIGLPGYPVSAYFVFDAFVTPLIFKYLRHEEEKRQKVKAILSSRLMSSLKHLEFVRIKLGKIGKKLIATPLNRGAGVTMSLVRADGVLKIPKTVEGIEAGEKIEVELLKDYKSIENTIVSIGSHDIIMDIIANEMNLKSKGMNLSSAHVGSLGGIMAIRRGECHIAPIHLLDDKTGVYNIAYARKYLGNKKMALIKGVKRVQGLMVREGNPKNINSIKDLIREDVIFANRQKGAGTRVLLDYKLNELSINSEEIKGYDREMTTHMTVATAVLSGTADVGMGIESVAKTMHLDFIPIGEEDYDFLVEETFLEEEKIKEFIKVLKSEDLAKQLEEIGGYCLEAPGEIVHIN